MGGDDAPQRLGRYRILDEIGRGGMATVYHAIQEGPHGFENHVALKLIHERLLEAHPRVVKMLVDEARVAARINHPNVLRILDLVEQENRVYMVMDFVDGISMRGVLDHARETRCPAQIAPIVEVLTAACEGIHAAHQLKAADGALLNLVHRDMKPGNIMVSIDGQVKVGDFGIALFADRVADSTAQGQLKGTPAYMSPEQTLGGPLDGRSDVFSMGLTLYTLATNKLAFRARKAMQIALKIARESMEPHAVELEGIAEGLGDILRKACARDPDDRYQDAAQLGEALRLVHDKLENPQSISEMLIVAGWRATNEEGEDIDDPLIEDNAPHTPALPSEPIEGPEEHELTQTGGEDDTEVDTHTYIPTVTELVTDLDATPLSSPRTESTEPLMDSGNQASPAAAVVAPRAPEPVIAPDPPAPPTQSSSSAAPEEMARPFDPNAAAAAAGPLGSTPQRGQAARFVGQERDFRGRVIPKASAEQTRIGAGEKLGVALAAAFLIIMVLALAGYLVLGGGTQTEQTVPAEQDAAASVLPGGVAISERKGAGRIEAEEDVEIREEDLEEPAFLEPETMAEGPVVQIVEEIAEDIVPFDPKEGTRESTLTEPEAAPVETKAAPVEAKAAPVAAKAAPVAAKAAPVAAKAAPVAAKAAPIENPVQELDTAAEPGLITVSSYPWSEVWIDGKRVGEIPLN